MQNFPSEKAFQRFQTLTGGVDWTPPVMQPVRKYYGADWYHSRHKRQTGKDLHPEAVWVLDFLGEVSKGLYNFRGSLSWGKGHDKDEREAQWAKRGGYLVKHDGYLSTWDDSSLTRLVFLAHDWSIRVEVKPYTFSDLELLLNVRYQRHSTPDAEWTRLHPSLKEAVTNWRHARPERG